MIEQCRVIADGVGNVSVMVVASGRVLADRRFWPVVVLDELMGLETDDEIWNRQCDQKHADYLAWMQNRP